jgi:multiple sugar transport system permease protein
LNVTLRSEPLIGTIRRERQAASLSGWLDRESVFSWLMMAPPLLFLAGLVGYPFCYGILLSLQDRPVAHAGTFVGLKNFATDLNDPIFWKVTGNTFLYTAAATLLKMVGGLALALAMNQQFPLKNLVRALLLLPFIVPTVLSTVAWMWILDPAFSVLNWFLLALGMPKPGPSWLGNPVLAMASIIVINTWRGLPFYGITLLAGLQTVPPELYEAATIDGASGWQRFRFVTLPLLQPIILIVTLFSVIFTFADFQLVYVLTHGGPQNATQLFATYAFDIAMGAGQLGHGASVALAMFPALALLIFALTIYMRKK